MTRTRTEISPSSGLSTEQSIIDDMYSSSQPGKPFNKKAKFTVYQDEDINFNNNSSGTETVLLMDNTKKISTTNTTENNTYNLQLPPEPSLAIISKDVNSLNASSHNPHMMVNHQAEEPINQSHDSSTTPPESQNTQIIPDMKTTQTLQIEHISLDNPKQVLLNLFYSLIIKEEFGRRSYHQISEIITEICGSFPGFLKIENIKEKFNHVEIVKISFINETSRNSLSNVTNKQYNITFHNYDKTSLEIQTNQANKHKEERTIKVTKVGLQSVWFGSVFAKTDTEPN
ncbi:hypothetical protein RclHR1_03460006 [Rhizophagus clarus]|nr:hypothetical protein RclHR1_03460006 [Rhizophagus clarus]